VDKSGPFGKGGYDRLSEKVRAGWLRSSWRRSAVVLGCALMTAMDSKEKVRAVGVHRQGEQEREEFIRILGHDLKRAVIHNRATY